MNSENFSNWKIGDSQKTPTCSSYQIGYRSLQLVCRFNELTARHNQFVNESKLPNADYSKILNRLEDKLDQLQLELEVGKQRQLSIGR